MCYIFFFYLGPTSRPKNLSPQPWHQSFCSLPRLDEMACYCITACCLLQGSLSASIETPLACYSGLCIRCWGGLPQSTALSHPSTQAVPERVPDRMKVLLRVTASASDRRLCLTLSALTCSHKSRRPHNFIDHYCH